MDSPTTPLDKESVTSSELEEGEIAPELDSACPSRIAAPPNSATKRFLLYTFTRLVEHNRTEQIRSPKSTNERETRARAQKVSASMGGSSASASREDRRAR